MDKLQLFNYDALMKLDRDQLDCLVNDVDTGMSDIDTFTVIKKFEYIIKGLIDRFKEKARESFLITTQGNKSETLNGFKIVATFQEEWKYSQKVTDLEKKIKVLQADLKALKEFEKIKDIAVRTGVVKTGLTLTMK